MANEVRFTIKLNVDGQTKVVDVTAAVDELTERPSARCARHRTHWPCRKAGRG